MAVEDSVTGSGGGGEMSLEYASQHAAELQIVAAADALDAVGSAMPGGDYGEAGAVIATIMGTFTEAAAQLVTEAKVMALGVRVATGEMAGTDTEQALDFMRVSR